MKEMINKLLKKQSHSIELYFLKASVTIGIMQPTHLTDGETEVSGGKVTTFVSLDSGLTAPPLFTQYCLVHSASLLLYHESIS